MDAFLNDDMLQEMLGDFLDEATQLLDRLNENLLTLDEWVGDGAPDIGTRFDAEILNEMFRAAHSLKGLSAMLNLTHINRLTHKLENLFDAARKDELVIDRPVVDLMFQAADRLRAMVEALREQTATPVEADDVVAAMTAVLERRSLEPQGSVEQSVQSALTTAELGVSEALRAGEPVVDDAREAQGTRPGVEDRFWKLARERFETVADEVDLNSKYLALFIDELEQSLDSLTETLLATEAAHTPEGLENLLCMAHRVKGSAASVGFHRVSKLAHIMEDVLQALRDMGRSLTPELNDCLLRATDTLREFLNRLRRGELPSMDFTPVAAALLACEADLKHSEGAPGSQTPSQESEGAPPSSQGAAHPASLSSELIEKAREFDRPVLIGRVELQPGLQLSGLKGQLIYEKLCHLGEVLEYLPPMEQLETAEQVPALEFILATEKSPDEVSRGLRVGGVRAIHLQAVRPEGKDGPGPEPTAERLTVEEGDTAPTGNQGPYQTRGLPQAAQRGEKGDELQAGRGKSSADPNKSVETLRVDIERLDQLMNLAGQLVITRARLSELSEKLKHQFHKSRALHIFRSIRDSLGRGGPRSVEKALPQKAATLSQFSWNRLEKDVELLSQELEAVAEARTIVNQLLEAVHQLDRVTDGIQRAVMETRMVPIGPLFNRFRRVVRDVTRVNGKQIQLVISGEKTELDKRMIDELADPLIHLVRNAADHGIEPPEVRKQLGKPPVGTIALNAFHRGNSIVIQVSDDGKGLDAERILQKALERHLIPPAQAEKLSRDEIYRLIFLPGLSTAEKVTEVSGRGMGMDIVKAKIEELSGTIELESTPGVGTKVTIKLPLTLAILPSLLVRIDGDVFAMPIEAIREIVAARSEHLTTVHGMRTARIRNRIISVIELADLLSTHYYRPHFKEAGIAETTLVILGDEEHEVGLVVDEVLGEEDVVIKSIAENYRNIPGIAGASILGNGRVSLILDVAALLGMVTRRSVPCPA